MSQKLQGPTAATRSRTNSDKATGAKTSQGNSTASTGSTTKSDKSEKKKLQKLVSAYFSSDNHIKEVQSDSEITTYHSKLKRRSVSGKTYKTSLTIESSGDAVMTDTMQSTVQIGANAQCADYLTPVNSNVKRNQDQEVEHNKNNRRELIATAPLQRGNTLIQDVQQTEFHCYLRNIQDNLSNITSQYSMRNLPFTFAMPAAVGLQTVNHNTGRESTDPVLALLTAMNQKLNNIQDDVKSLKESTLQLGGQMSVLQHDQEDNNESLQDQCTELRKCRDQVQLLSNVVTKYENKFEELQSRVDNMEAKAMRAELIVFGIDEDDSKTATAIAKSFFKEKLEITEVPDISDAYWKGKKKGSRPMVIKLSKAANKGTIYKHALNLKGKKTSRGKSHQINDHQPDILAEHQ